MLRDAAREGAVARAGVPCTLVRTGALRSVPAGSGGLRVLQVQRTLLCQKKGVHSARSCAAGPCGHRHVGLL